MMAPPAKENLPPKKRKENRPPLEVRNYPDWAGFVYLSCYRS